MKIKIGTRGSKLALWQAHYISTLLINGGLETEILTIETKGDKVLDQPFAEIGTKGIFTEELEHQLLTGDLDIAVHSAKDMQSTLPEGLEIIAFSERETPNDVLISFDKNFKITDKGKKIGTSSTRRTAVLHHYYPGVEITGARGNLQTRMKKMEEKQFDAMILAYAGVHRMGYDQHIVEVLPLEMFTPMIGQGCVAIESATNLDSNKKEKIKALLNNADSWSAVTAERAYLRMMDGGCTIPVFGYAFVEKDSIILEGGIISKSGDKIIREKVSGKISEAERIGESLANLVLNSGGREIRDSFKK